MFFELRNSDLLIKLLTLLLSHSIFVLIDSSIEFYASVDYNTLF